MALAKNIFPWKHVYADMCSEGIFWLHASADGGSGGGIGPRLFFSTSIIHLYICVCKFENTLTRPVILGELFHASVCSTATGYRPKFIQFHGATCFECTESRLFHQISFNLNGSDQKSRAISVAGSIFSRVCCFQFVELVHLCEVQPVPVDCGLFPATFGQ